MSGTPSQALVACSACQAKGPWHVPKDPQPRDTVTCQACGALHRYEDFRRAELEAAEQAAVDAFRQAFKTLRGDKAE